MSSMTRVGFSTRKKNVLSRFIRWATGSKVSHSFFVYYDSDFQMEMVMEADITGFQIIPLQSFTRAGNAIFKILIPRQPIDPGLHKVALWLGEPYDFGGLFGMAWVLLGRWLKKKWRNPISTARAMFCSEAVARALKAVNHPGTETWRPTDISPQDLLDFLEGQGCEEWKGPPGRLGDSTATRSA